MTNVIDIEQFSGVTIGGSIMVQTVGFLASDGDTINVVGRNIPSDQAITIEAEQRISSQSGTAIRIDNQSPSGDISVTANELTAIRGTGVTITSVAGDNEAEVSVDEGNQFGNDAMCGNISL